MLRILRRTSAASPTGWCPVCLHEGRIDVASVLGDGAKPVVTALESYERTKDDVDSLKRLGRKYRLDRASCATLLAPSEYQLLQVEIPADLPPEAVLKDALREAVAGLIDQPMAHVTFDAVRIPTKEYAQGRAEQAYVIIAGNAAIAPRVQMFHAAQVGLKVIDIPEMAQRNVAALCEEANRALAFLCFEQDGGLLTFTCNGELYMSRRIDIGLRVLLTDDMERRSNLFDRIGLEVQRSMDNFDRQFGFLPLSRLLLGPQPGAVPLQGFLHDYLGSKVDVLDLAEVMDISAIPELKRPERQAQCLATLGVALRNGRAGAAA